VYKFKPVVVLDGREGFAASSAEWLSSSWHVFADKLFCDGSMLLAVSAFPRRRARGKEAKKARCAALTPLYLGFKFYLCAPESTRERERESEVRKEGIGGAPTNRRNSASLSPLALDGVVTFHFAFQFFHRTKGNFAIIINLPSLG
jgi:hypothetical protein